MNVEIKRGAQVAGIFPIEAATIRVLGAILLAQNNERTIKRLGPHAGSFAEL